MKPRKAWNDGLRFSWSRHAARRGSETRIVAIVFTRDGARLWLNVTATHVYMRAIPPGVRWFEYSVPDQCLQWQSVTGKLPLSRGAKMVEAFLLDLGAGALYEAWDMDARKSMIRIDAGSLTPTAASDTLPA